jgi:hypothetical protein
MAQSIKNRNGRVNHVMSHLLSNPWKSSSFITFLFPCKLCVYDYNLLLPWLLSYQLNLLDDINVAFTVTLLFIILLPPPFLPSSRDPTLTSTHYHPHCISLPLLHGEHNPRS